ncbi:MAG: HAD hydrolase-like protein [Desulfobulbaceae bacterium]|nr:HAD hydrolase-like protein [Desulfobulbaceae bacterium]
MSNTRIPIDIAWKDIDTVLLDMDGTLLDRHFDDYFWHTYVPETFSIVHDITVEAARAQLLARYKKEEGTLAWTDLDFWSRELGLDIPALKMKVDQLIQVHPYVLDFLKFCQEIGKGVFLVTNAHSKTLDIKIKKTAIGSYFDRIICSQEVGVAKEDPVFWQRIEKMIHYDPNRTMLADDTENVLISAEEHGIKYPIYVARPSSTTPVVYSDRFPSIVYFKELIF